MKVKDLIKQLLELKPESQVSFQISDGCCGDYEELGPPDLDEVDWSDGKNSHVNFRFPALEIISSCIASGIAKRAVANHRAKKHDNVIFRANADSEHRRRLKNDNKRSR